MITIGYATVKHIFKITMDIFVFHLSENQNNGRYTDPVQSRSVPFVRCERSLRHIVFHRVYIRTDVAVTKTGIAEMTSSEHETEIEPLKQPKVVDRFDYSSISISIIIIIIIIINSNNDNNNNNIYRNV